MNRICLLTFFLVLTLSACSHPEWGSLPTNLPVASGIPGAVARATNTATLQPSVSPVSPTGTQPVSSLLAPIAEPSVERPTLDPQAWKSMPIVPQVSQRMVDIYRAGQAAGRDPARFSKIGDCQNITTYFLADFDHPGDYSLGTQYAGLQATIDHFSGSWSRESLAVKGGLGVAAALDPHSIFKDVKTCGKTENPLACELRVYNPSLAIISMETWYGNKPVDGYENYLRQIVEYTLSQDVVPILATKADNLEGNYAINQAIARVAYDYQVPLWNFWAATWPLPSHGLTEDLFHLTQARSFFDDPDRMEAAWPWRNLTALQAIGAVYRAVSAQP